MKKAEYPQKSCRLAVPGAHQDYPCELPGAEGLHPGPCATFSIKASAERRDAWEAEHPGWEQMMKTDDPFVNVKP